MTVPFRPGRADAEEKFVRDFAAAWAEVMELDRFDLARTSRKRLLSPPVPKFYHGSGAYGSGAEGIAEESPGWVGLKNGLQG